MNQKKRAGETKKWSNFKTHNQLLKTAIVLQVIHFPLFIASLISFLSRYGFLENFFKDGSVSAAIFFVFFVFSGLLYILRWYYWGIVIIEGIFLLVFLFKTGDVFNTIKKEKKKYILFLLLLICNLLTVIFYYDSFWHGVVTG